MPLAVSRIVTGHGIIANLTTEEFVGLQTLQRSLTQRPVIDVETPDEQIG